MKTDLYYNPKEELWYLANLDRDCDNCGKKIVGLALISVYWDKIGSGISYYCLNCKKVAKKCWRATYGEIYQANVSLNVPRNSLPMILSKPSLSDSSNLSTFDIKDISSVKTVDNTVYANRSSNRVKEYVIESDKGNFDLLSDNKPLSDRALDKFFSSVKSAVPIGFDDKPLLEDKRED